MSHCGSTLHIIDSARPFRLDRDGELPGKQHGGGVCM